jgi:hypothetical protein
MDQYEQLPLFAFRVQSCCQPFGVDSVVHLPAIPDSASSVKTTERSVDCWTR